MTTTTYRVDGMTCEHCVNAVSSSVANLPGVVSARVDLDRGEVTISSGSSLDRTAVAAAVREAGYQLC